MSDDCPGGATQSNGNCTLPAPDDGLAVQCVGAWVTEKHDPLKRYIEATREVRGDFLPPPAWRGGAAFIDLFAGPGRARVRTTGDLIDGSPLIAARHEGAPFTHLLLCEKDAENATVLRQRLASDTRARVFAGDCNDAVADLAAHVPPQGLNIALLDPFGVTPLRFETIARLATFSRMDVILHFPTGDLKRNLQCGQRIDRFVGTKSWRERVKGPRDVGLLAEVLKEQLRPLGYGNAYVGHMPAVKNDQKVPLYHLAFVAKHPLAERIWQSVIRIEGSGQKRLFT
jgi:three-Cys-motif partner protein